MHIASLAEQSRHIMRHNTAIVIPVYLPSGTYADVGEAALEDTVAMFRDQVSASCRICLSVDGEEFGAETVRRIADKAGVAYFVSATNGGKLMAVTNGVREMLKDPRVEYLAIVDQDGDHFANELLNLVRAAHHISIQAQTGKMLVLGRRISRHRPMGFHRGEIEELCDRVLLDALLYNAAMKQRPLRLEYATTLDEFPDFHSGYKLLSRSVADAVFLGRPQLAGVSETCYYRHACEAVMVIESLECGAYLGSVNRSTLNHQPFSVFDQYDRVQLAADKIVWPCKRLSIPLPFVKQWLANHINRLLLATISPDGARELEDILRHVTTAMADGKEAEEGLPLRPLFV
jgi:hypothetical protein